MAISFSKIKELTEIARSFQIEPGTIDMIESFGNGRINQTYKITIRRGVERFEYLLQNINSFVFGDTKGLMENLTSVTDYIRNTGKHSLEFIKCCDGITDEHKNGDYIFVDKGRLHWRMYHYVDADVYPCIINPSHANMLGSAIADFSTSLDGFDSSKLIETIPYFHDTPKRFNNFLLAIADDVISKNRRCENDRVRKMIEFVLVRKDKLDMLTTPLKKGIIPNRVVHNDPKINNVLFDKTSREPICMIDLDTIMPGTGLYDVGDAIRSICNNASEEDKTTENVSFNIELYTEFVRGYIKGMGDKLTSEEAKLIPHSAWILAMELGIRFLADHIDKNIYFKTEYDGQNIERAAIQFALAECIEAELDNGTLQDIVKKLEDEI